MADVMGLRKNYPQERRPGGQKINKTKNICSIVIIIVQYLDSIITIIFSKFQTLVTSITGKVIDVSGKKPCFKIINGINKW